MRPKNFKYRFYIGYPTAGNTMYWREVLPVNTRGLKIQLEREGDSVFMRRKLSQPLRLKDGDGLADYSWVYDIENDVAPKLRDVTYYVKIERQCNGIWSEWWMGMWNLYSCIFDTDNCTVDINTQVFDQYTCLLEKRDKKYNLYDINDIYTITAINPNYQVEVATYRNQFQSIINIGYFTYCNNTVAYFNPFYLPDTGYGAWEPVGKAGSNIYQFGNGWVVSESKYLTDANSITNQTIDLTTTYTRLTTVTVDDPSGNPQPPVGNWTLIAATTLNGMPAHYYFSNDYQTDAYITQPTRQVIGTCGQYIDTWSNVSGLSVNTYYRNRYFVDVIKQISNACNLTFKSDFFTNSINPITQLPSETNNIFLAGKLDIKDPTSAIPQTLAEYTWDDIETWIKEIFNCYWYIDTNNTLIIEHYDYFKGNQNLGIDARQIDGGKWIRAKNKYQYPEPSRYSRERWQFMESSGYDFKGADIVYGNSAPNVKDDNVLRHDVSNVMTDLGILEANPTAISDDGFVMMACYVNSGGDLEVINETGLLSNTVVENGHLSIANLHYNYFRYGRLKITGTMNNVATTFLSAKRIKQQVEISFPLCCVDIDETKLVRTEMGDGEVDAAEFDLMTEMQAVQLLY